MSVRAGLAASRQQRGSLCACGSGGEVGITSYDGDDAASITAFDATAGMKPIHGLGRTKDKLHIATQRESRRAPDPEHRASVGGVQPVAVVKAKSTAAEGTQR